MMRNPARRGVQHGEMRELELYIDNTEPLYRQSLAIQKNLITKINRGRYDHRLAPKPWLYLVNEGARRYVKEFGGNGRLMFPLAGKKNLARRYANQFIRMLRSGEIGPSTFGPNPTNPTSYRVSASVGRSMVQSITPPEY